MTAGWAKCGARSAAWMSRARCAQVAAPLRPPSAAVDLRLTVSFAAEASSGAPFLSSSSASGPARVRAA